MRMLLVIAGLTLIWFVCGTGSAQPMGPAAPKGVISETVHSAKELAFSKAVDEITGMMRRSDLTSFVITKDYVREKVLVGEGKLGDDFKVENIRDPFKAWTVTFRTDTDWWKDIVRKDH